MDKCQLWRHSATIEPLTKRLWLIGYNGLLKVTVNTISLKILALESVAQRVDKEDHRLDERQLPKDLKKEIDSCIRGKSQFKMHSVTNEWRISFFQHIAMGFILWSNSKLELNRYCYRQNILPNIFAEYSAEICSVRIQTFGLKPNSTSNWFSLS